MRFWILAAMLSLVLAGCASPADTVEETQEDVPELPVELPAELPVDIQQLMSFTEKTVTAAVKFTNDLYEPTMEVSDSGVIYVTGHTILVDTTGAPVFMSKDDGETWEQLPFLGPATMPGDVHGATPPPSDEIFLVAGDNGQLWGVDITLLTFPVNGWCNDGAELCYHNPNAYDEVQAQTTRVDALTGEGSACSYLNLNDRPWAAYGGDKLLMVNNPGGGPVQVGLMDVPPAQMVGGPQLGVAGMGEWNLCAGAGGGYIPGIPDMRDDHFFAVPQSQGGKMVVVMGKGDVFDVEQKDVFEFSNTGGGTSNYGQVNFDQNGDMFVVARANQDENGTEVGYLKVAVSTDDGESFAVRTFETTAPVRSQYMDGNMAGPGALLTWGQIGADGGTDWYAGHLQIDAFGAPVLENVSLALKQGPNPSAHVQGAAAGPDGRAYLVMDYGGSPGSNPLTIVRQDAGPALPIVIEAVEVAVEPAEP